MTTLSCKKAAEELLERCLRREPWPASLLHRLVEGDCSGELFGTVVEGLSNRFDPELCDEYARLFSQALAWANPGLNARALVERYDRVRRERRFDGRADEVRRIVVLSRVTLGADIAVTSVILDALKRRFPTAGIFLAGSRQSWELFAADPRIQHVPVFYPRRGTLRDRLIAWIELKRVLPPAVDLVVDPDSRLTQLGLLPVCPEEKYYFFESRSWGGSQGDPLSLLAAHWAHETFGVAGARPWMAPQPVEVLPQHPLVAVSFGSEDHPCNAIGNPFERDLLETLVSRGAQVYIDGAGEQERVNLALSGLEGAAQVHVCKGTFSEFAGIIARSDLYIGYASAAMHAAAACGAPLLAIFAGFPTERTFQRWQPVGPGPIEVLKVTDRTPGPVLRRTLQVLDRLLPGKKRAFLTSRAASMERVAVVRALPGWGDMLCSVPALRALRRALPHANITLVGLPWAAAFVKRFSRYVDDLLEFPGFPGFPVPEKPEAGAILAFLAAAHGRRFDIALQMHGSGITSNPFTEMLGARCTAGCYVQGNYCPDPERFLPYSDAEHEIRRSLRLLEFLGVPSEGEDLEFPLIREDWAELSAIGATSGLHDREYVCIHPGASSPARRWIPERFARVADALAQKGFPVVLTGSAAERDLAAEVAAYMQMPFRDLTGPMSFGALGALISRARLLICNDTGISHLASALRVPSVVVFTAADPERWAPLDHALHRAVHVPVGCRPCEYRVCPIGHPCSEGITAGAVLAQAESLLRKEQVYAA